MARMLGNNEIAYECAKSQFWVVEAKGLITEGWENIDPDALPFARNLKEMDRQGLRKGASLVEVVKQVNPDVLLGLSAVGGLFSKYILYLDIRGPQGFNIEQDQLYLPCQIQQRMLNAPSK
ncbi:NAD-dependent malic enzyme 1, mitochondrial-like isoform X1 [Arachis hypogaea]|uniref:NAD-dependent malic enzyme 1, mitochondrial-like isoform X1 n=1 Tax=Arachis hypogaea TaxID=3818 RepID=UPI003B21A1CA